MSVGKASYQQILPALGPKLYFMDRVELEQIKLIRAKVLVFQDRMAAEAKAKSGAAVLVTDGKDSAPAAAASRTPAAQLPPGAVTTPDRVEASVTPGVQEGAGADATAAGDANAAQSVPAQRNQ